MRYVITASLNYWDEHIRHLGQYECLLECYNGMQYYLEREQWDYLAIRDTHTEALIGWIINGRTLKPHERRWLKSARPVRT